MNAQNDKPSFWNWLKSIGIVVFVFLVLFSFLPFLISLSTYDDKKEVKPYAESKFVTIDNIKIHYQEWNSDQKNPNGKILFIHGFYGSTFTWRNNINELIKRGFYVILVDIPGFGYSSKASNIDHTLSGRANLLWKFLDNLDSNFSAGNSLSWILVGHSMGGAVAAKMAEIRDSGIADLILVDPVINTSQNGPNIFLQFPVTKRWISVIANSYFFNENQIQTYLKTAYGREPASEEVKGYLDPLKEPGSALAAGDIIASGDNNTVDLSKIKIATQIIYGEKDPWVKRESIDQMYDKLEFSIISTVKDAAHIPQETNSDEFNKDLLNFVAAQTTGE